MSDRNTAAMKKRWADPARREKLRGAIRAGVKAAWSRRKAANPDPLERMLIDKAVRAKQDAKVFELGAPMMPDDLWSRRPVYQKWVKYRDMLLAERKLAYCDGDALLKLCEASVAGHNDLVATIYESVWANRPPFPVA